MTDENFCCRQPAQLREGRSPFHRVIALGWYDGPISGLLECGVCGRAYRFDLICTTIVKLEGRNDLRIYRLAPLTKGSLDRLEEALAPYQILRHSQQPVWVPLWKFPTEADHEAMDGLTQQILGSAGPPELAVATEDLVEKIMEARELTAEKLANVSDWFRFMRLPKDRAKI
jgi:hypothetical protein